MKINENMSYEEVANEVNKGIAVEFFKYLIASGIAGGAVTYIIRQSYKLGALAACRKAIEMAANNEQK